MYESEFLLWQTSFIAFESHQDGVKWGKSGHDRIFFSEEYGFFKNLPPFLCLRRQAAASVAPQEG